MVRIILLILISMVLGCAIEPSSPIPPPPPPEVSDFAKVELSNKFEDTLNAWLRANPNRRIVTFFVDRWAYVYTEDGENLDQIFIVVDGDIEKIQKFLNQRKCRVIAMTPLGGRYLICISEK